jgi:hypothetical protein
MFEISPPIIVHSVPQTRLVLAYGRPVTLLSAPGAAEYAGCLWWKHLLTEAEFFGTALLDCGDAPGRALEALKLGLCGVILRCPPASYAVVAEIAAAQNALLLPQAPPALDLAQSGAARHMEQWLEG